MDEYMQEDCEEPVDLISNQMDHQHILNVLSKLSMDYQSVLTLRFIGELSPEETAQVMNRSVGAIRVLQHRALGALRDEINGTG
jgi:RNA polymerase sigma factor (sigma-70 family)